MPRRRPPRLTLHLASCWFARRAVPGETRLMKISRKTCRPVPWCAALVLLGLTWLDSSIASDAKITQPDRKSVVVLGDSLAAGYGLDPSEAFPALLQKKV